jgi:hypothetical protein
MKDETRNRSCITILGVLILGLSVTGCDRTASEDRIRLLIEYAEEKTKELEGKREFERISISYTTNQGGKLWVFGFVPEDKEDELKALLQTDLSPEEIVWKVYALDSESFQNVQVIDMTKDRKPAAAAPTAATDDVAGAPAAQAPATDDSASALGTPTLTTEELVRALQMKINWWEVALPEDLPPDSRIGLVIKDADGSIIHKTIGSTNPSYPGGRVKVIVWDSRDGMSLNYAVISSRMTASGPSISKTEAMKKAPTTVLGRKREMGDILMKFSPISPSGSDELLRGDIGLSLDIVGTLEAAPQD